MFPAGLRESLGELHVSAEGQRQTMVVDEIPMPYTYQRPTMHLGSLQGEAKEILTEKRRMCDIYMYVCMCIVYVCVHVGIVTCFRTCL